MSENLSKKRIIMYVIIFVTFALLIVFLSRRTADKTMSTISENSVPRASKAAGFVDNQDVMSVDVVETPSNLVASPIVELEKNNTTNEINEKNINIEKRVIKKGHIDMRVNSVENAIGEIKAIAVRYGGDEVSSDVSKSDIYKEGYIVVKVPVNQYDQAFEEIKKIAPLVMSESSNSQDVTAQFIDLESRIKNKKKHEEQLRTFFNKAEKVDELIQIERELARVRTEIEQMEGQMNYLKEQTQYSTIDVSLLEDANIVVSDSWRPMQVVRDSFNTLIKKTTNLINIVLRFMITSLPFIILFVVGAWFLYFTAKHIFGQKKK